MAARRSEPAHQRSGAAHQWLSYLRKSLLSLAAVAGTAAITWAVTTVLDKGANGVNTTAPVAIHLDTRLTEIFAGLPPWQSYGFVAPSADPLPEPPSSLCREWQSWAYTLGGVDADQTRLQLQLQGQSDTAILIDRVEVKIERRDDPLQGTQGYCAAEGGAVSSPRLVDIDLDTMPPTVLFAKAGDDYPFRHRLPLTLAGPETEILEIRAHTRSCDCLWHAKLHMVVGGKRCVAVIANEGEPFRTTASVATRHLTWQRHRWRPMSRQGWRETLPIKWVSFTSGGAP